VLRKILPLHVLLAFALFVTGNLALRGPLAVAALSSGAFGPTKLISLNGIVKTLLQI
jgi:hypothetical protein